MLEGHVLKRTQRCPSNAAGHKIEWRCRCGASGTALTDNDAMVAGSAHVAKMIGSVPPSGAAKEPEREPVAAEAATSAPVVDLHAMTGRSFPSGKKKARK